MSIVPSFLILCLCFSLHACNARLLRVVDNGGFDQLVTSPSEESDKFKLNMDSTAKGKENGDITQNSKESKTIHKKMINRYAQETISGNEIVESSSQLGLLKATAILVEDSRWQERILLELRSHEREEGDAYKRSHEEEEQIDYEPPHKKTPIHNK